MLYLFDLTLFSRHDGLRPESMILTTMIPTVGCRSGGGGGGGWDATLFEFQCHFQYDITKS